MTPLEQAAADYADALKARETSSKLAHLARDKANEYSQEADEAIRALDVARNRLLDVAQQINTNQ